MFTNKKQNLNSQKLTEKKGSEQEKGKKKERKLRRNENQKRLREVKESARRDCVLFLGSETRFSPRYPFDIYIFFIFFNIYVFFFGVFFMGKSQKTFSGKQPRRCLQKSSLSLFFISAWKNTKKLINFYFNLCLY